MLSEKIEEQLTLQKIDSGEGYLDLLRGARIGITNELRKLFYLAIRVLPLLILFIIPGLTYSRPFFGSCLAPGCGQLNI